MKDRKKYFQEYYKKNKDKILKYQRKHWSKHLENCRKWNKNNVEIILENSRKRRRDNPEYCREWQKDNSKRVLEIKRKYSKTEKGRATAQRRDVKRRIKERDIINTLTLNEWLDILEAYNYKCAYCGVEFDCENLPEKDHVIPISKGGDNTKENVVLACRSCNASKGNRIRKKRTVFEVVI